MDNYIVINGKKAELTEEQLVALGIKAKSKTPFELYLNDCYFYIDSNGNVQKDCATEKHLWTRDSDAYKRCEVGNYCTDRNLMRVRAAHETLNRLLWRYSMEHDGDKIRFNNTLQYKYYIVFDLHTGQTRVLKMNNVMDYCAVYFYTEEIAENAIKEVVAPFLKKHPEF